MNEKVILKSIKEGNREALGLLWKEHSANVLNLAFRMMKDRDRAEDILMDVFVQVPSAIQQFRGESALGTWLYRLTVNACLMKLRSERRHGELELQHQDTIEENAIGHAELPADVDTELLEQGLAKLPADTRSMLWLKDAESLDVRDLSDIYGMPDGTIKARLSRARHLVKDFVMERLKHA